MQKDNKFGLGLLVGVAAGIAGSYLVAQKKEEIKNKLWMLQAEYKIRSRARLVRDLTQETFSDIVDSVMREYEGVRGVTSQELGWFADKVKRRWQEFKTRDSFDDETLYAGEDEDAAPTR